MVQQSYQILGDENLNEAALNAISAYIPQSDRILYCSGFDFESKVIAVTNQSVIVGNDEGEIDLSLFYSGIGTATNEGRTLVINTVSISGGSHRYRMGSENVVRRLASIIRVEKQRSKDQRENESSMNGIEQTGPEVNVGIGERVKFWEEQDKINQELIPRVIRQHELLTGHIADHENLPLVAGNAISEALADAREEQRQFYEAALEAAKQEQQQQYDAALEAAKQEQQQQYDIALEAAKQEQQQLHDAALDAAKTAINDEAQTNLERAVTTLDQEWRKTRNILIGITAASGAIAVAAIIIGILI